MATPKYKKSANGFYKVSLARTFPHQGHDYKPSADHTVNEELLEVMLAEPELIIGTPQPA